METRAKELGRRKRDDSAIYLRNVNFAFVSSSFRGQYHLILPNPSKNKNLPNDPISPFGLSSDYQPLTKKSAPISLNNEPVFSLSEIAPVGKGSEMTNVILYFLHLPPLFKNTSIVISDPFSVLTTRGRTSVGWSQGNQGWVSNNLTRGYQILKQLYPAYDAGQFQGGCAEPNALARFFQNGGTLQDLKGAEIYTLKVGGGGSNLGQPKTPCASACQKMLEFFGIKAVN